VGAARPRIEKISFEERVAALLRQYGRALLGLLVLVMIVHDIFGTHGFLAMRRTEDEIKNVQANLDKLSKENAALEEEVKDLKSDPRLIEKIARDDLGLARPGEVIIRIPPGQGPTQEPQEQAPAPATKH
jgi:cell division protein FtsB